MVYGIRDARPFTGEAGDPCLYIVEKDGRREARVGGERCPAGEAGALPVVYALPLPAGENFGGAGFRERYGTRYAYYGGAMAGGIASVDMVTALGRAGFLGSYGAGGQRLSEVDAAIQAMQRAGVPYMVNLLHSMSEAEKQMEFVALLLARGVRAVEASAFIDLSPALLWYRVAGLVRRADGSVEARNRVIAKLSREEVAARFLAPPDAAIVDALVREGRVSAEQAELAREVPVADDITAEADSGGHTDNRPLVSLFPALCSLRDALQGKYGYRQRVGVGAAGGIATPASALAAFAMGAEYIVTGSVNQACVEAGTSELVKKLLADVGMADVVMAPCADLFELGAKVQVIKRGTMFPMNAQKLYELYTRYASIEEVPAAERNRIEKHFFQQSIEAVWEETRAYFEANDPRQLALAQKNPKVKMGLLFRWYLGHSSRWAIEGRAERRMDMQIWCGQSMGAFNAWCRGTPLEKPENRRVAAVAQSILQGAAQLEAQNLLCLAGVAQ